MYTNSFVLLYLYISASLWKKSRYNLQHFKSTSNISKYIHPHFDLHVSISYITTVYLIYILIVYVYYMYTPGPILSHKSSTLGVAHKHLPCRGHRPLGLLRSGTFQRAERFGQRREASGNLNLHRWSKRRRKTADLRILGGKLWWENWKGKMWV